MPGMEYVRRVLISVGITTGILVLLALLWYTVDILLLVFAAILLAVLLRAPADWVSAHTPLPAAWSVIFVIILLALLLLGGGMLVATPVMEQFDKLSEQLPQTVDKVKQQMLGSRWGERIIQQAESTNWNPPRMNVLGKMTGALSTVFGVLANFVLMCFLGLYFAVQPDPYIKGLLRIVPVPGRQRAQEVLQRIGHTLQWWLLGKLCSMAIIGILTGLGLWLLDMPLVLALALLAGLFSFVPYLGPIVSAVPALLLALSQDQQRALYVLILYIGVQAVEGNLLTPLVQQKAVSLPAAMILFAQIMLGVLVGGIGIVLATPLAAVILVAVKMLYIEDILGDTESAG